jgi:hypothetical protein
MNKKQRKSLKIVCSYRKRNIILRFIVKIVVRFWRKLIIQSIIYFDILLFRKSWINRSCKIVSNVSITSRLNIMTIRFVLLFHTMCICFVKSFSVDSINLLLRHLMWKFNNNRCVFVNHAIRLFMIDFIILLMMFKRIMNRYVFEMM